MKILRAKHLGMCFGVKRAIALALETAARQPLTVLGELVHNESVLTELDAHGIRFCNDPAEVETHIVMVTAHGVSERRRAALRARGFKVLEATCPLVRVAHQAVAGLVQAGFHPVIIGQRDHVEVRGLTEDLAEYDVVLSEAEVLRLRPRSRFGVMAQTTQPAERVREVVTKIRQRFPAAEVRFVDTVCLPTKLRQQAAAQLARQCDVVVVIGGARSNNTRELVQTCGRYCGRVHHVPTAQALHPEWFAPGDTVGLTAGTSTPDHVIAEVEAQLQRFASPEPAPVPIGPAGPQEQAAAVSLAY